MIFAHGDLKTLLFKHREIGSQLLDVVVTPPPAFSRCIPASMIESPTFPRQAQEQSSCSFLQRGILRRGVGTAQPNVEAKSSAAQAA